VNSFQVAYLLALVALTYPAWGWQRYALGCLWGNLLAMLAASLAMDLGALDRADASITMMLIDLSTGAALSMRPGLSRVIAAGYAVTVPLYVPAISGLFTRGDANFTIIYIVASLQLGALAVGSFGGFGGGSGRRRIAFRRPVEIQGGNVGIHCQPISSFSAGDGGSE
jgi:hypothetical protein